MPARIRFPLLAVLLAICASAPACAQVFDLDRDRVPMAELNGAMRFHLGDDSDGKLGWASTGFDDSSWQLISGDRDWAGQGYPNVGGMAWYRFKIQVPAHHPQLALAVPFLLTSYQVYADGALIGQMGGMPPNPRVVQPQPLVFRLPRVPEGQPQTVVIAIRVWHWPAWARFYGGGMYEPLRVGDAGSLNEWLRSRSEHVDWDDSANNLQLVVFLLVGAGCMLMFAMRRRETEYFWFGTANLLAALDALMADWTHHFSVSISWNSVRDLSYYASSLAFLQFVMIVSGSRKRRLYWLGVAVMAMQMLLVVPTDFAWTSPALPNVIGTCLTILFYAVVLLVLAGSARAGNRDSQLVFLPVALFYLSGTAKSLGFAMVVLGHSWVRPYVSWINHVTTWPFPVSLTDLTSTIEMLAVLVILLLRFVHSRREEERFRGELQAARSVQSVLVPDEIPPIPGFKIQSVYHPASEVGGDFFQVIPLPDGGVVAAIGDVSGKGMPAAMTVSLLVGTLRTLVHYSQSPGEILSAMNQRMIGRTKGGFTTCLVLCARADGALTIASAGHQMPYIDGAEIAGDTGLPLGIVPDSPYPETSSRLGEGVQLTLITDGVLEARDKSGELFGFERTTAISTQSAEQISACAQHFGQEDDITVVTVTRETSARSATFRHPEAHPATLPA